LSLNHNFGQSPKAVLGEKEARPCGYTKKKLKMTYLQKKSAKLKSVPMGPIQEADHTPVVPRKSLFQREIKIQALGRGQRVSGPVPVCAARKKRGEMVKEGGGWVTPPDRMA
jgi:hypothetical protein